MSIISKEIMTHRLDRSESEMRDMDIFGCGNPIVDIVAEVDEEFLKSYNLPKNSAILADIQHEGLYDEVVVKYEIDYSAGGSVQNALRYAQWVVGKNNPIANYIGAVGDDYFGKYLANKVKVDGLNVKYMVVDDKPTGACTVLFNNNGKYKSVCANLGASTCFDKHFLMNNFWFCERARVILTSGHLLPVSPDSVMYLAKHCHEWGKDFVFNMGASYVIHNSTNYVMDLFPYIDFLFCSADEALAFATVKGYHTRDLKQVVKLMADEPKVSYNNPNIPNNYKSGRVVVVNQRGGKPVLLAKTDVFNTKEYPVPIMTDTEIIDTSGMGDALIGGFLAMYIDGQPFDVCVQCGIYCATECCRQSGCILPEKMKFKY